ncbi:phage-related lysozyme (muraminidase) [Acidovorax sp. CF316]|uniref:lysozyme n=1 Tax=Acidovorax sp. CF316 TaxID=1144317 RepID=UPI00026BC6B1|nr:glycoside hydrolase family protein [Acidovorax sp. CF316]EJE53776.1 phage-related lysozyme (muraminidase) [Acidovorax sp. CF316]
MNDTIKKRLLQAALAISVAAAGGVATHQAAQQPSAAVLLAMELGNHYESSGRHIGTPYVDKLGKGQPLTVCDGVTGPEVVAGRTYTPEDCKRLELPKYREAERQARQALTHWGAYNPWVQASFIDMIYNLGPSVLDGTTIVRMANAGNLVGACMQMPRWVRGTVGGQSVVLPGLVDRRDTTRELCTDWGRDGHFSAGLLPPAGGGK